MEPKLVIEAIVAHAMRRSLSSRFKAVDLDCQMRWLEKWRDMDSPIIEEGIRRVNNGGLRDEKGRR